MPEKCVICGDEVKIAIFKGTGVCCENHRKEAVRKCLIEGNV